MPDANGKFRGVAINGRAAATWERCFAPRPAPRPKNACSRVGTCMCIVECRDEPVRYSNPNGPFGI